uniref:Peptidase_S24 domain-containing protein n=1 Tax=Trichuris muris TaxID=70415 RepID=A0A5S6QT31_TRIMR
MPLGVLKRSIKTLATVVTWGSVACVFNEHFYSIALCKGDSMVPTIEDGDIFILKSIVNNTKLAKRGDIVVSLCPEEPSRYICKRVVAVEGSIVPPMFNAREVRKGHIWLEGDNKKCSHDSRNYGDVPYALLKGLVIYRIWPWDKRGPITLPDVTSDRTTASGVY